MLTLAKALEYIKQRESGDTINPTTLSQHSGELTFAVVSPVEFSAVNAKKHPEPAFRVSVHTVRKFNSIDELRESFLEVYPDHGTQPIVMNGTASVPLLPGIFASYVTGALYLLAQRLRGHCGGYVMNGNMVERDDVLALCTGRYVERVNTPPRYDRFSLFAPALHNIVAIS